MNDDQLEHTVVRDGGWDFPSAGVLGPEVGCEWGPGGPLSDHVLDHLARPLFVRLAEQLLLVEDHAVEFGERQDVFDVAVRHQVLRLQVCKSQVALLAPQCA
jgi:hypothetical protein